MSQWISFKRKLPEFGKTVLVRFQCGHVEDASIYKDGKSWKYTLFDGEELMNDRPLHWMPLPEEPK